MFLSSLAIFAIAIEFIHYRRINNICSLSLCPRFFPRAFSISVSIFATNAIVPPTMHLSLHAKISQVLPNAKRYMQIIASNRNTFFIRRLNKKSIKLFHKNIVLLLNYFHGNKINAKNV